MAQYDLLLTQNIHATLIEYEDRFVNIGKGDILSAIVDQTPTVLAGGTDGYVLVRDDLELTGLKWVDSSSLNAVIVTNQANDRIVTATAVTDTLNAEEFLTYNTTQGLGINAGLGIVFAAAVTTYRIYTPDSIYRTSLEIISGDNSAGAAGDVTIQAGSGTSSGGNVYFNRDTTYGDFFFGTGAAGHLPAMSSEADVVFYDSTTGKLSYGVATGIYTFENGLTETGGTVKLGGDLIETTNLYMDNTWFNIYGYDNQATPTYQSRFSQWAHFIAMDTADYSDFGAGEWIDVARIQAQYEGGLPPYRPAVTIKAHKRLPSNDETHIQLSTAGITILDENISKGMIYEADYSTAGEADDRWIPDWGAVKGYADGAGVSFGLNNHIPVTNQQVNDFDYTDEFQFTQGSGLLVMNSIQLVSTGWGPGCKILTETTGELTNVHTSVYNGSGYDIIWVGGWSQGSTGAHTGGNVTIKGGEQTGGSAGDGGSVYIYGGPSTAADRGSVYFGDGSTFGTLLQDDAETAVVGYDTTTGLLTWIDKSTLGGSSVSFGTAQYQIPLTNSGLDDFEYSSEISYNSSSNIFTAGVYNSGYSIISGFQIGPVYGGNSLTIQPNDDTNFSMEFRGRTGSASTNPGKLYITSGGAIDSVYSTGADLFIAGGRGNNSGDSDGGHIYMYAGIGYGSGSNGGIYIGTGAEGLLPNDEAELNVVAFDVGTGLLSYRSVSGLTGGAVFWGTPGNDYEIPIGDYNGVLTTAQTINEDAWFAYNPVNDKFEVSNYNGAGWSDIHGLRIDPVGAPVGTGLSLTRSYDGVEYIDLWGGLSWAIFKPGEIRIRGGDAGTATYPNGGDVKIIGGIPYTVGDNDGGDIYIYGGPPDNGGARGEVYFGDGTSIASLQAKGSETNVVYYDTTTGLLTHGVPTDTYSGALTDGAPTDAEIDSATGTTPAAVGAGWQCTILDTDGSALIYLIVSDGTNWQYTPLTIAT